MPRIERHEIKHQSVESALAEAKLALLPKAIRDHRLVRWVLSFDRSVERTDIDRRRLNPADLLLKEIGRNFVQPAISYYHSVLMILGPQWALTDEGQSNVAAVLYPANLERSIHELATVATITPETAIASIEYFARGLDDAWQHRVSRVREVWNIWELEVQALNAAVTAADERRFGYDSYPRNENIIELISVSGRHSRLSALGFVDDRNWDIGFVLGALSFLGLGSLTSSEPSRDDYFQEEFLRLASRALERGDEVLREESQRRTRLPILIEERRALDQEYDDGDPFESYRQPEKPADSTLARLAAHNRLDGKEDSRWLREFVVSLPTLSTELLPKSIELEEPDRSRRIRWGVETADGVIKAMVVRELKYSRDAVQRAYEKKWIEPIAHHYIGKKWNKEPEETNENFFAFVGSVNDALLAIGAEVELPSSGRLEKLAGFVRAGQYYEDWGR